MHWHYPYTEAQFQAGKINREQKEEALLLLDTLASAIPLQDNTLIIHTTCSSEQMQKRLEARGRKQNVEQVRYWDLLRSLSTQYFRARCRYVHLDTTSKTPEELLDDILAILFEAGFESKNNKS